MSIVFKACPTAARVFAQNLASIFALYLVLLLAPQVGSAHAQTIMRAAKVGWVDWVRSTAFLPSAEAYCSAVLTSPVAPGLAIFWQPHPACIVSDVSTFVCRPSVLQTVFHIADPDNLAYCHSVSYPNYPLGIPCSYTNDQFHVRREAYCPHGFIMTGQIANGSAYGLFGNLTYFDLLGIRDVYSTSVGIGGAPICILNATDPDKNANDCPTCGNPIHPGFGNKTQAEIDYSAADSNLRFIRNYNSVFTQGALIVEGYFGPPTQKTGTRWRTNYQRTVSVTGNAALTTAAVTRPDGNTTSFNQSGADWIGDPDIKARLIELKDAQDNRTGWKYITSDDDIEQYDSNGKLLTLQNRSGIKQTLAYSDANTPVNIAPFAGLLISVTDSFGKTLDFTYDSLGRLATMTDPAGELYQYTYDTANNLTSVTYPGGAVRTYHYNEAAYTGGVNLPNHLTGISDENGARYATYTYNTQGRAIATEHAGGVEKYSLNYGQNQATVTDPLGTVRTSTFTNVLGVVKNTGTSQPGSPAQTFTYDANGNISSQTDYNGNKTCFAYDMARNLETSRIEGLPGNANCATELAAGAPPALPARRIDTAWHPAYRLPVQTSEPTSSGVRVTVNNYDAQGNLLNRSINAGGQTRSWSWTYNPWGRPLTATDAENHTTTYTYYADNDPCTGCRGQLKTIVNALGHLTQFTAYNAHGASLSVIDPNGVLTTFSYDARNRLISQSRGSETTTYQYDPVGQLTKITLADGAFLNYSYDAAHRLTGLSDSVGNSITYTLDAMGNRIKEETTDPNAVLTRTRSRVYNNLNRLQQELGANISDLTQYGYDGNGNRTSITDPLNHTTILGYDTLNRLTLSNAPLGAVIGYGYDSQDNLTQITDPKGLLTQYKWNGFGELTKQGSPDTGTTVQTTSANGIVLTRTDARGITAAYQHDALGRITSVTYPDQTITYGYDGKLASCLNGRGRLCSIQDASGSTAYSYDIHGRITSKTQNIDNLTQTITYRYNSAGQLAKQTYPSGAAISYSYANNRIQDMTLVVANSSTPIVTEVAYQPFGPVQGWVWGNDSAQSSNEHSRSFDLDGRLTGLQSGAGVGGRTISWDVAGRISTLTQGNQTTTYTYDDLDRLTSQAQGADTQTYSYDPTGNRLSSQKNNQAANIYDYPATSHRLQSITQGIKNKTYQWDQAGNLSSNLTRMWSYGGDGRLKMVSGPNLSAQYAVNALGQRIKKAVNGSITRFIYDEQGRLIGEYNQSGQLVMEHVWLNDTPVALIKRKLGGGIELYYVHADHLGTPRVITRPSDNAVVWKWDNNDPFGSNAPNEDPSGLGKFTYNLRLGGWQYSDAESGLFYNTNRYYDSQTGRYTQFDPMGLAAGINGFVYVGNNPLKYVDPEGLQALPFPPLPIPGVPFPGRPAAPDTDDAFNPGWGLPAFPSLPDWLFRDRTVPKPAKPACGCTCICRADANDNIPGNIKPGDKTFAFGEATEDNCAKATKEAKRIATKNLGKQPKHVPCKCTES